MQPAMQSPKSSKFIRSVKVIQVDKPDEGTAYSDMPVLNNTESVMQEIYSLDSQRDLCGENLSTPEIVAENLSPDGASGLSIPGSPCSCKQSSPNRVQNCKPTTAVQPSTTDPEISRENQTIKAKVEDIASGLLASSPLLESGNEAKVNAAKSNQSRIQSYKAVNAVGSATRDSEILRENQTAKIRVVVRKRPINKKEVARNEEDIIQVAEDGCLLTVDEFKLKVDLTAYVEKHEFSFDAIFDENVNNDKVYLETVEPIIPSLFQQTKATCFAYGQTGSGKTFTMQPLPLKASQDIFHLMQQPSYIDQGFELWISYFEIYGGKLFDLLNDRRKLCMREDGRQQVCIVGLKEFQIYDLDALEEYIDRGSCARSTGSTGANEESSRSHAILQLSIKKPSDKKDKRRPRIIGKLSFIDLAGNERGADTTDNDRQTRIEGAEINKSLLALKECIRALDSDQSHIPFRGSKLTEVLRDSFVGNSRTVMISCISPSSGCCEHTLNTLRYADRVKGLSKNSNSKRDFSSLSSQSESCTSPPQSYSQHVFDKCEGTQESELMSLPSRPHTASGHIGSQCDHMKQHLLPKDRFNVNGLDYRQQEIKPRLSTKRRSNEEQIDLRSEEAYKQEGTTSYILKPGFTVHDLRQQSPSKDRYNVAQQNVKPRLPLRNGSKEEQVDTQSREVHKREGTSSFPKQGNMIIDSINRTQQMSTALLKEEDHLVAAHCKDLEGSIVFVREEMKLLTEVDQPGSQINRYVSQLSKLLSKKAQGLMDLQARVARFQQLMQEGESLGPHQPG